MNRKDIHFWDIGPGYYIVWKGVHEFMTSVYRHTCDGADSTIVFRNVEHGHLRTVTRNELTWVIKATKSEVKETLLKSIK